MAVTQFLSLQVNHPNTVFIAPVPHKNKSDLNVDAYPLYVNNLYEIQYAFQYRSVTHQLN